ncbi:MotA/TolQ/ExbB proton channel family protein [Zoogloea sp.]|uniref:MotA/TolQ/ExbB proton channel family protein n=1 Tax=Zoogloea sp. TaxID=49181 RepID=UPI0035B3CA99
MNDLLTLAWLHQAVTWLLTPALLALVVACAIALAEAGLATGERLWGLRRLAASGDLLHIQRIARHRLERADLLARIPPMLGLMATIIPLGPGLAALGQGNPGELASAVTTAFDATVLGLVAGIGGLVVGKLRRRWYEELLENLEEDA